LIMYSHKDRLINNIINSLLYWLADKKTASTPLIEYAFHGMTTGNYYLLISRINRKTVLLQEILVKENGEQHVIRSWSFVNDKKWDVAALAKENKHVYLKDLLQELADLDIRIDSFHKRNSVNNLYYTDELLKTRRNIDLNTTQTYNSGFSIFLKKIKKFLYRRFVYIPLLVFTASVLFLFINSIVIDFAKQKEEVDTQFKNIGSFISEAEKELTDLKTTIAFDERDFEFDRRNAYINILRLIEEMRTYLPRRKEAYRLIADNIKNAVSYSEIIYEMSRLPSEEYQADIFLATDRQKIVSLSMYSPLFTGMLYPVRISNEDNDGKGFRITDGYMDKREDPLGSGGFSPHFAVDIMNVSNISYINYAGEIVRDGYPPGNVESVYSGIIADINFDDGYGWNIEVKHPLIDEIKSEYPDATSWSTFYAHLAAEPDLKAGKNVSAGEKLGEIGNSGRSTGPHLHFEVRIYSETGPYRSSGGRFLKINPYPES